MAATSLHLKPESCCRLLDLDHAAAVWGSGSDHPVPGAVTALAAPTVASRPDSSALSLLLWCLSIALNRTFWAISENLGNVTLYEVTEKAQFLFQGALCPGEEKTYNK